jgi:hypothetical protein
LIALVIAPALDVAPAVALALALALIITPAVVLVFITFKSALVLFSSPPFFVSVYSIFQTYPFPLC